MGYGEERTAVVLDDQPLWLDALEQLLVRANVRVVGKTTKLRARSRWWTSIARTC